VVGDELLMDRFRLLERIGSGGMGTVYRAFDQRLQREVAVKEVDAADPERVLREAQAAARLNHPGIVTLYEIGELDGRAILVSELVPGRTLSRLHRDGALCDREVAEIAADLCDALAHAHARGVVHRDVKPENVIVRDDAAGRHAKLMDFGIARIAGAPTLTAAGEVVGTLAYMSPEQADGELAGPESDVYSLALTAYECWSGVNPAAGATPAETARRIGLPAPPLERFRPDLPAALTAAVDACLDADPVARPSPLELRDSLDAHAGALDPRRPVPAPEGDHEGAPGLLRLGLVRVAALLGLAGLLALIAGPLGAGGLALVLAALSVPSLLVGASTAGLAPPAAAPLAAAGVGGAAAALGAVGASPAGRAVLGAGAWLWLLATSLTLGAGPELGIAAAAPADWASDPAIAVDAVLAPLFGVDSLLGLAVFATAGLALGWVLSLGHASIALLAAMLWAAGVDAALGVVGNGALSEPFGVVAAALVAVALEFGLARGGLATLRRAPRPRPLTT
jgi:hypothetical protein